MQFYLSHHNSSHQNAGIFNITEFCCLGTRGGNIQKEKGNKPQQQTTVVGSTKELVLEATDMKPLQVLPKAERRKLSQVRHIRGTRIPLSLKALRI